MLYVSNPTPFKFSQQNISVHDVEGLPEINEHYSRYKCLINIFNDRLVTLNTEVTVECNLLNPDWTIVRSLCSSK